MSQRISASRHSAARSEDQGYLASISDFMATLLFIFMITLMAFVINLQEATTSASTQEKELKQQIVLLTGKEEELKQQTVILQNIQKELTDARQVRQKLMEDIKYSLSADGIEVHIDVEKGLLHVPEKVLFPSGQANFAPGGEASLQLLGRTLAEHLPCYSGSKEAIRPAQCPPEKFTPGRLEAVLIEGHTDNVPIRSGQFKDNWQLSTARSLITFRYIMQQQPVLETLKNANDEPFFGVSAYGETRPAKSNESDDGRRANRRIDLRFILAAPEARR